MSYNSGKAYRSEVAVRNEIARFLVPAYRRGYGAHLDGEDARDLGDIGGIPAVIDVRDHARLALAEWVDALEEKVARTTYGHGAIWHKRRGCANAGRWYVTTTGALYVPALVALCEKWEREHG